MDATAHWKELLDSRAKAIQPEGPDLVKYAFIRHPSPLTAQSIRNLLLCSIGMSSSMGVLDVLRRPAVQHMHHFKYLRMAYFATFISHVPLLLRLVDASEKAKRSRVVVHLDKGGRIILRVAAGKHYTHSAKKKTICLEACLTSMWLFAEVLFALFDLQNPQTPQIRDIAQMRLQKATGWRYILLCTSGFLRYGWYTVAAILFSAPFLLHSTLLFFLVLERRAFNSPAASSAREALSGSRY